MARIEPLPTPTPTFTEGGRLFAEPDGVEATWIHRDARQGFECAWLRRHGDGHRLVGHTTAREDGVSWSVGYRIDVDSRWRTVAADLVETVGGQETRCLIESDGDGRWLVDGVEVPDVEGCLDIDLESSALTNTIFLHRVQPSPGETHPAPAAYVRCAPLRLERLEQTYRLAAPPALASESGSGPGSGSADEVLFEYTSPAFGTDAVLRFDRYGLVIDYPGLAVRHS